MKYDMEKCGTRIQQLRTLHNYTQEQFAEALNIDRSFLSRIEAGKKGCSVDLLIQLSEFFNVSLDYLIMGKNEESFALKSRKHLKDNITVLIRQLETFESTL